MVTSICEDQKRKGVLYFGTWEGLVRYERRNLVPPRPTLSILTDREYHDLSVDRPVTQGGRVIFRFDVADFKARPEDRLFRWQVVRGRQTAAELRDSKT